MRPFWKSASSKGYSPCKVLTFGQKLQFQKTCQNPLYKSFRVVLCKKLLQKNIKYSRNAIILKIGQQLYYIAHAKSSLWVKNYNSKKDVKIYATNHWEMFSGKNRSKKHSIFEKQVYFENRPSSKGCSNAKSSLWVKNYNSKKHVKIHCTNHLELFCAEDRSKRH